MTPAAELLRAELRKIWAEPPRPPPPGMENVLLTVSIPRFVHNELEHQADRLGTTPGELAGVLLASVIASREI